MSVDHSWHVEVDRLQGYASGATLPVERGSIEAHLLACEQCRSNLATVRPAPANDAVLQAITDRIDQPRRILRRSTGALQVSLASPPLIVASVVLAATLLAAVGATAALDAPLSVAVLIAIAPLVPIAATVVAFWPTTDPAGSLAAATPLAAGRLPFLRAVFASAVSAIGGLVSSALTPLDWTQSLVWLAPGFALAALAIAAATWINPVRLAAGLAAGWGVLFTLWARGHRSLRTLDAVNDLASRAAEVQTTCIVVIVLAAVVALWRRDAQPNWRTT